MCTLRYDRKFIPSSKERGIFGYPSTVGAYETKFFFFKYDGVCQFKELRNKTTRLTALTDFNRIVAFGNLPEQSRDVRLLVTTANLRKFGFFNPKASVEPLVPTMPYKVPRPKTRTRGFVFPRVASASSVEAILGDIPTGRIQIGPRTPIERYKESQSEPKDLGVQLRGS
ncbi:uncharacterized protein LOC116108059 [Pistacia vera]|uniref:uncharacterized protein LOC116108059 n=1 Tax=Pistacia vera TaxID=55513 RepID=UPI00126395E7|nr:uncharacterized protein LOC116108059 [Pistacia vera]